MGGRVARGRDRTAVRVIPCAVVGVLLTAACGGSDTQVGAPSVTGHIDSPASSTIGPTPLTSDAAAVSTPPAPRPHPDEVAWLAPATAPPALRLIETKQELLFGCESEHCDPLVPGAELRYDTDDVAEARWLTIEQALPVPGEVQLEPVDGDAQTVGGREVTARYEPADSRHVHLAWIEPSGIAVSTESFGLTPDDLDAVVSSLQPIEPDEWPGTEARERLRTCIDETTRYAPAVIPDGWVRHVLEAHPSGTCDVEPFLWMSLVEPGTADGPGKLVTMTVSAATSMSALEPAGEAIVINGHPAVLEPPGEINGEPTNSIFMEIGAASVSAHGNVDADTLQEIMTTVDLLDEPDWNQLVDEVVTEP